MRVFCCSYQPYAIQAVAELRDRDGWQPVYFHTTPGVDADIAGRFPDAVRHPYMDAVKGRPASQFADVSIVPDTMVMEALRESRQLEIAIKMFDRNQSVEDPLTQDERATLIGWFSGHWSRVLLEYQIELVVFEEVPHQVSDFMLYACAGVHNVKRLVPIRTLPRSGYLLSDRYDAFQLTKRENLYPAAPNLLPLTSYAKQMRGTYATYAQTMFFDASDTARLFTAAQNISRPNIFGRLAHRLSKQAIALLRIRSFENDRKQAGKRLTDSRESYWAHRRNMKRTIEVKNSLRRLYEQMTSGPPNLGRSKFVFCALQYQPEASTCPKGGPFVDQLLMVRTLLAHLPAGWRLAVKEHPNQFSSAYARFAETARTSAFYAELTSDPRVDLVPLNVPSFEVVDAAQAVASVGGTICLEGVVRGKPSLNFGTGFFDRVHGIFKITDTDSVKLALGTIAEGYEPDLDTVMNDLQTIDDACYPGAIGGPVTLEEMGLSQAANANIHAQSWREWLGRQVDLP